MWLFVVIIVLFAYYVYRKINKTFSYWSSKGVKGPKPDIIFGNLKELIWPRKYSIITIAAKFYNDYISTDEKVIGLYQGVTPTLLVRDPEIFKLVLFKNFHSFNSRGLGVSKKPIMLNLFVAEKDDWKYLRKNISPVFSTKKIKDMIPVLNKCIEKHMDYLDKMVKGVTCQEIRTLNIKYTLKSICSVALNKDFNTHGEEISEVEDIAYKLATMTPVRNTLYLLKYIYPGKIVEYLHLISSPLRLFFVNLVKDILVERSCNTDVKNDFMDHLIHLKTQEFVQETNGELRMSDDLIVAQTGIIFGAGFETTSSSMSLMLYELALHPKIQARCQMEIDITMEKYNSHLGYDALKELKYVSMAMDETLRKYPVGGIFARDTLEDYTFKELNLTIDKGTKLWIPILTIHNDPKYFPEPKRFDPERFLPENRDKIKDFYYPFGGGPRNCIGMNFAKIQFQMGIAHFLHKFQVSPCEKTPEKITFDPMLITLYAKGGIWLNIEKRK